MEIKNIQIYKAFLNRNYNKVEKQFIIELKKTSIKLIHSYEMDTKANIDSINGKKNKPSMFLWQETMINEFKIYVTMLGLIDRRILYYEENNNFVSIYKEDYDKLKNTREEISGKLKLILDSSLMSNSKIGESISEVPSFKKFDGLYNEMEKRNTILSINTKFMIAYNEGYGLSMEVNLNTIINEYTLISSDIDNNTKINKEKVRLAKIKKFVGK